MWNVREGDARARCITRENMQGRERDAVRGTDGVGIKPKYAE